jgi:hypothetical protein
MSTDKYKCEYCNNILSSMSSLNNHQKTNKKCLSKRRENNFIINKKEFICPDCCFKTLLKQQIILHKCRPEHIEVYKNFLLAKEQIQIHILENKLLENKLIEKNNEKEYKLSLEKNNEKEYKLSLEKIEKLKHKNEKLKTQLKENFDKQVTTYQNQLFTLASKPTSIKIQNLNNVLTSLDFKENTIKEKVDNNFTLEYLSEGIKGVAKFTKEHIINPSEDGKQKYICSDPSRGTFKYKDENGVIQKDVKATKLKKAIQEPIINKTNTLISHETTRVREDGEEKFDITNTTLINNLMQVKNLDDNGSDYAKEMSLVC